MDEIKRGYLYIADLDPVKGSEQGGRRPVLVVQNDAGNQHSPTVIIAAITSQKKPNQPTHVCLKGGGCPSEGFHGFNGTDSYRR